MGRKEQCRRCEWLLCLILMVTSVLVSESVPPCHLAGLQQEQSSWTATALPVSETMQT